MLTNKYLKYSPEITLEIFKLVWNKLIDSGINAQQGNDSVEREYALFSSKFSFLRLELEYTGLFGAYTRTHDCKETTVQEILGYDPFVKDDFVLPKKWCIKTTTETDEVLCKWRGGEHSIGYKAVLVFDPTSSYPKCWESADKIYEYPEITFDQFKKYVLKESVETPKEVIPEYVEYIKSDDIGKIVKVLQWSANSYCKVEFFDGKIKEPFKHLIKPSTKEAFDAQNQPKSIEKWSVGSYVVAINDGHARGKYQDKYKIGFIDIITNKFSDEKTGLKFSSNCCNKSDFKWFATKSEAEEFAKTLLNPIEDTIECETCNGEGQVMVAKLYPSGHTEVNETCPDCNGDGIINKPKQPLKEAVHCKTQEKWDFVQDKIGYKFTTKFSSNFDTISLDDRCSGMKKSWYEEMKWNVLSFQEWCQQNGYKMEKEVKFEVGKWYQYNPDVYLKFERIVTEKFRCSERIVDGVYSIVNSLYNTQSIMPISIEEIQQYLPDGHPDLIKSNQEFKVGQLVWISSMPIRGNGMKLDGSEDGVYRLMDLNSPEYASGHLRGNAHFKFKCGKNHYMTNVSNIRHATPEEIDNHLISTGEILSADTAAGLDCSTISSYDSVRMYYGGSVDTRIPRKINWTTVSEPSKDEVRLELIDIPKI